MNKNQHIVLFTSHFPYGYGEPFIDDEIKVAERYFDKLTIISGDKDKINSGRYVPKNAEVIQLRKKRFEFFPLVLAVLKMLLPCTWREKRFAYQQLKYQNSKKSVNKAILITHYISILLNKTLKKISVNQNTILYSYWLSSEAYFLSQYKKKHPNVLCISRTHGGDCFIDRFYQPFRREIIFGLDAIFPISDAGKRCLEEHIVPYTSKSAEIIVKRLGTTNNQKIKNPGKTGEEFCIVTCSNVIPIKRLDLMIDALNQLKGEKISWVHFGDGEIYSQIQEMAAEKLISGNVSFEFKGRVPKQDILKWYEMNHVDLFLNCSDSEGIPVSIMEAFSYGIPTIARDVGGMNELVNDENGILLPTDISVTQLADGIRKYIHFSEMIQNQHREAAYHTFCNQYDSETNHEDFYRSLVLFKKDRKGR